MSNRKLPGTKLTTLSFKLEEWEAEFVNEYVINAGALLGMTKGKALVYAIQILKRYGDLPSIIAGGFLNMQGTLERIEANSELAAYGNDLEVIAEARLMQIESDPEEDTGGAYGAFMEAGVESIGDNDLDAYNDDETRIATLNEFGRDMASIRLERGYEKMGINK